MNISANSNIYEVTAQGIFAAYEPCVERPTRGEDCLALALSSVPLGSEARAAVEKSLEKLGYGAGRCAFAALRASEGGELGPAELLNIIEGIDPLCLIVADKASLQALEHAYRTRIAKGAGRLLGRPFAAFANLEKLLETPAGKQSAWAILKQL